MKYKIGDKVLIKTWKAMEQEFKTFKNGTINCSLGFPKGMGRKLIALNSNRTLIIAELVKGSYRCEKIGFRWSDNMIEELASSASKISETSISSRFDILDL